MGLKFNIESRTETTVTRVVYQVSFLNFLRNKETYFLTDLLGKDKSVIDTYVKDEYGNIERDPEFIQEMIQFIEEENSKNEFK